MCLKYQDASPQGPAGREAEVASVAKETLIQDLNGDLAGMLGAIIQRLTYAAKTTSRYGRRLTEFFLSGVASEQVHAQVLAKRIVTLGGEPTTVPRAVPQADTNSEMLEALLASMRQAVEDLTQHMQQAEEYSDRALAVELGDMIREEKVQADRTERILRDWQL
jgi:bacterioferritin